MGRKNSLSLLKHAKRLFRKGIKCRLRRVPLAAAGTTIFELSCHFGKQTLKKIIGEIPLRRYGMYKKILLPVDLSERSFLALPIAFQIANAFNAELSILHVEESFMTDKEMVMLRVSVNHYQDLQKEKAIDSKRIIAEYMEKYNIPKDAVEVLIREGSPRKDIVRIAHKRKFDLIIMTTTGRDHLVDNIIGSNAESVLKKSKMSVFTVYTGDK